MGQKFVDHNYFCILPDPNKIKIKLSKLGTNEECYKPRKARKTRKNEKRGRIKKTPFLRVILHFKRLL